MGGKERILYGSDGSQERILVTVDLFAIVELEEKWERPKTDLGGAGMIVTCTPLSKPKKESRNLNKDEIGISGHKEPNIGL